MDQTRPSRPVHGMYRGPIRVTLRTGTLKRPTNVPEKLLPILRRRLGRGFEIRARKRRHPVHTFHLTRREVEEESVDGVREQVREDAVRLVQRQKSSSKSTSRRQKADVVDTRFNIL